MGRFTGKRDDQRSADTRRGTHRLSRGNSDPIRTQYSSAEKTRREARCHKIPFDHDRFGQYIFTRRTCVAPVPGGVQKKPDVWRFFFLFTTQNGRKKSISIFLTFTYAHRQGVKPTCLACHRATLGGRYTIHVRIIVTPPNHHHHHHCRHHLGPPTRQRL